MPSMKQRLLKQAATVVGHENLAKRLNVPASLLDARIRGLATMPNRKLLPLADLLETLALPKKP